MDAGSIPAISTKLAPALFWRKMKLSNLFIMAKYVDGFLISLPKKNLDAYRKMAEEGRQMWMKYGALDYKECIGEDLQPQHVQFPFTKAIQAQEDEVVVFSYIVFKSRAHRDEVNAKVMADPAMKKYETEPMPFDMSRFAYGGFEVIVEA